MTRLLCQPRSGDTDLAAGVSRQAKTERNDGALKGRHAGATAVNRSTASGGLAYDVWGAPLSRALPPAVAVDLP